MGVDGTIEKLGKAKKSLTQAYKDEADDDLVDNGNLQHIHEAILHTEQAIEIISKRNGG